MSELWTVTLRFRGAHAPPVSLFYGGQAAARKEFSKFVASVLVVVSLMITTGHRLPCTPIPIHWRR